MTSLVKVPAPSVRTSAGPYSLHGFLETFVSLMTPDHRGEALLSRLVSTPVTSLSFSEPPQGSAAGVPVEPGVEVVGPPPGLALLPAAGAVAEALESPAATGVLAELQAVSARAAQARAVAAAR